MRARRALVAAGTGTAVIAATVATILLARQGAGQATPLFSVTMSASPLPTGPASHSVSPGTPTAATTLHPTPSSQPPVDIAQVVGAGNLEAELLVIYNRGDLVDLTGWTLSDTEGDSFIFPDLTLFPDGEVRVRSVSGSSGPAVVYWGRTRPAWQSGDLITLRDAEGTKVDAYLVP
jgi:hypothetical protein